MAVIINTNIDCSLAVIRNKERFGTYITRMGITLKTGIALRLLENDLFTR